MKSYSRFNLVVFIVLVITAGCKKEENPAQSNNANTTNCNFTTDVVAVDGATKSIIKPLCHILGTSYFAEFLTDTSAAPTGIAMIFAGTTRPAPGAYTPVSDFALVTAGKVYVEYYDPANAWQASSGTVTVTASGSQVTITFCSLTLSGAGTKVVSVRATTNL